MDIVFRSLVLTSQTPGGNHAGSHEPRGNCGTPSSLALRVRMKRKPSPSARMGSCSHARGWPCLRNSALEYRLLSVAPVCRVVTSGDHMAKARAAQGRRLLEGPRSPARNVNIIGAGRTCGTRWEGCALNVVHGSAGCTSMAIPKIDCRPPYRHPFSHAERVGRRRLTHLVLHQRDLWRIEEGSSGLRRIRPPPGLRCRYGSWRARGRDPRLSLHQRHFAAVGPDDTTLGLHELLIPGREAVEPLDVCAHTLKRCV